MDFIQQLITHPIVTLVLGALLGGSYATYHFGIKRAKWDAKRKSSSLILSAISDIHEFADRNYADEMMLVSVGADESKLLSERFRRAQETLSQFANGVELLIPDKTSEQLKELLSEVFAAQMWIENEGMDQFNRQKLFGEYYEKIRSAVDARLPTIRKQLKRWI